MRLPRKTKKKYKKLNIPYNADKEQFTKILEQRKLINKHLDILYPEIKE